MGVSTNLFSYIYAKISGTIHVGLYVSIYFIIKKICQGNTYDHKKTFIRIKRMKELISLLYQCSELIRFETHIF